MQAIHPLLNKPTEVEIVDDSHRPWILVRCKSTNFHFIANPPEYDQLSNEFAWEKTLISESERRHKDEKFVSLASDLAKKVKFFLNPNRDKMFELAFRVLVNENTDRLQILDVGCGNGKKMVGFCERFEQFGVEVTPFGVEVSTVLSEESNERFARFGGRVIENNAIDGIKTIGTNTFDAVTMLSFLEHEARPLELLAAVRCILKPGGFIILKVPNFDSWNRHVRGSKWAGFRFPDHVSYFTPSTLEILAENAGYTLLKQNLSDRLPTNDNMYAVMQSNLTVG